MNDREIKVLIALKNIAVALGKAARLLPLDESGTAHEVSTTAAVVEADIQDLLDGEGLR